MPAALPFVATASSRERLSALFDAHYTRLYRLARRLAPSIDDALDLVQETFLRASQTVDSVPDGTRDEEAWLVRILVNISRDQWRKRSLRDRYAKVGFGSPKAPSTSNDAEDALIARTAVWKAVGLLSPRRRAVVVMYELEGLAMPAIASLLGISAITVRWHLSRGRRELANALKPHLGDPNEKHK